MACAATTSRSASDESLIVAIQHLRQTDGMYATFDSTAEKASPDLYASYYGLSLLSLTGDSIKLDPSGILALIPAPSDHTYLDYAYFAASLLHLSGEVVSVDISPIVGLRDETGSYHRPQYEPPPASVPNAATLSLLDQATATYEALSTIDLTGQIRDADPDGKTKAWLLASLDDAKSTPYAYYEIATSLTILGQQPPAADASWLAQEADAIAARATDFTLIDLLNAYGLANVAKDASISLPAGDLHTLSAISEHYLATGDLMDMYLAAAMSKALGVQPAQLPHSAQAIRSHRLTSGLLTLQAIGTASVQSTYYALGTLSLLGESTNDSTLVDTLMKMRPSVRQLDPTNLDAWLGSLRLAGGPVDQVKDDVSAAAKASLPVAVAADNLESFIHATTVLGSLGQWAPVTVPGSISSDGRTNRFALASLVVAQVNNPAFSKASWQSLVPELSAHLLDPGLTTLEYATAGLALRDLGSGLTVAQTDGLKSLFSALRRPDGSFTGGSGEPSSDLQGTYFALLLLDAKDQ
jgi:hypothetical protein